MTSHDLELSLENLSVDVAFGYTERPTVHMQELRVIPQYEEKYFFIKKMCPLIVLDLSVGRRRQEANFPF